MIHEGVLFLHIFLGGGRGGGESLTSKIPILVHYLIFVPRDSMQQTAVFNVLNDLCEIGIKPAFDLRGKMVYFIPTFH